MNITMDLIFFQLHFSCSNTSFHVVGVMILLVNISLKWFKLEWIDLGRETERFSFILLLAGIHLGESTLAERPRSFPLPCSWQGITLGESTLAERSRGFLLPCSWQGFTLGELTLAERPRGFPLPCSWQGFTWVNRPWPRGREVFFYLTLGRDSLGWIDLGREVERFSFTLLLAGIHLSESTLAERFSFTLLLVGIHLSESTLAERFSFTLLLAFTWVNRPWPRGWEVFFYLALGRDSLRLIDLGREAERFSFTFLVAGIHFGWIDLGREAERFSFFLLLTGIHFGWIDLGREAERFSFTLLMECIHLSESTLAKRPGDFLLSCSWQGFTWVNRPWPRGREVFFYLALGRDSLEWIDLGREDFFYLALGRDSLWWLKTHIMNRIELQTRLKQTKNKTTTQFYMDSYTNVKIRSSRTIWTQCTDRISSNST